MKRSIKKLLASLLALAMIASVAPLGAMAEETEAVDTSFVFGTGSYGGFNYDTVAHEYGKQVGGIGGKASDDLALAFVYDSDEPLANDKRWSYPFTHIEELGTSGGSKGVYFEFNIYADGNATARVDCATSNILLWAPDGTVSIPTHAGTTVTTTLERGKWHKVGLSLNESNGGRFGVYFDGVRATDDAATWDRTSAAKSPLYFSIEKNSTNGIVAYDDPSYTVWYGSASNYSNVVKPNDIIQTTTSDYFDLEEDKSISVKKYMEDIDTYKANLAEVFTNESEVRLLCDDMTTEASAFEEVENVLVKTVTNAYYQYTVNEYVKSGVELIGLEKVKDEGSTADDNWLGNVFIVDNQKVAVYSNEFQNLATVSSERLIEKGLVSTEGYTLSYVDENKEPATSSSIQGGFVKASKEGEEDIYIEIVNKYNVKDPVELTAGILDKRGSTLTSATGVAGKASDDVSHGFVGNTHTWTQAKYYFNEEEVISTNPRGTRTYVFNMYVDGDAVARFGIMYDTSAYYLMEWHGATGDLYLPATGTSMSSTSEMKLETGRWHQVAFSMDRATGGKSLLYIDGKVYDKSAAGEIGWNNYNGIALGVGFNATSGKVLFDDIVVYNGFYDPEGDVVKAVSATENFALDPSNNVIYCQNFDVAGLKDAILENTDASDVKLYADSTMAQEATEINADTYVMTTSANGLRFAYYTVKSMDEAPVPEFTFNLSTYTFDVTTKVINAEKDTILYLATYSDDDTLVNIVTKPIGADELNKDITVRAAYGSDSVKKVKAFLWYEGLKPIAYATQEIPAAPAE